jgi:hypothetical protein
MLISVSNWIKREKLAEARDNADAIVSEGLMYAFLPQLKLVICPASEPAISFLIWSTSTRLFLARDGHP